MKRIYISNVKGDKTMTKKITISVPDNLHSKMEKWKDSFNFSRVFQEAIREKINRKEEFKRRLKEGRFDMEATIERLRGEKKEAALKLSDQGKNDGFMWAKNAHYLDIQAALQWRGGDGELPDQKDLRNEIIDRIHNDPDLGFEGNSWEMDDVTARWAEAWVEGVQEFWKQVEDKI